MCEEINDRKTTENADAYNVDDVWDDDAADGDAVEDPSDWKEETLANCRRWIDAMDEEPPVGDDDREQPDLYSFYEELAVLRNEFRKNSRRSHETFVQFGDHLDSFDGVMKTFSQRLESLGKDRENAEFTAMQGLFLHIIEIDGRLRRFYDRMQAAARPGAPPAAPAGFWARLFCKKDKPEEAASPELAGGLAEGFAMILSHVDDLLAQAGIQRIAAVGAPFDPTRMTAVGVATSDGALPDTVVEEVAGGYVCRGHVLKLAQVIVSRKNG